MGSCVTRILIIRSYAFLINPSCHLLAPSPSPPRKQGGSRPQTSPRLRRD
ncbi:hypothetical protein CCP3SC1_1610003 [Gammaproteobacteria bacterium]